MTDNNNSAPTSYNPWQREIGALVKWRVRAWLPWVLLHIPASWIIVVSSGPRGGLLPWVLYALFSWTLCLIVIVIFLFRRKNAISYMITITLLVAGPLLSAKYEQYSNRKLGERAEAAAAEVRRLCEEYGGEEIYRTVEGVEGVFQMVAMPSYYKNLDDQFGRTYPWNRAMGDDNRVGEFIHTHGKGYWYVELQPEVGESSPPYYRRVFQYPSDYRANQLHDDNEPQLEVVTIETSNLKSRYGWLAEDLTTPAMREQWIGGGRIKIIDLASGQVLAEMTGFFRGSGEMHSWERSFGYLNEACPSSWSFNEFLLSVLVPVGGFPSPGELNLLKE